MTPAFFCDELDVRFTLGLFLVARRGACGVTTLCLNLPIAKLVVTLIMTVWWSPTPSWNESSISNAISKSGV